MTAVLVPDRDKKLIWLYPPNTLVLVILGEELPNYRDGMEIELGCGGKAIVYVGRSKRQILRQLERKTQHFLGVIIFDQANRKNAYYIRHYLLVDDNPEKRIGFRLVSTAEEIAFLLDTAVIK
ncbi:MAG TPA: hypothetical protein VEA59_01630 [Patescibacteria group bacterium]|nr:hypothetical protein [Patescibacteria group bacterium]